MTGKEKADLRLNCLYGAITIMKGKPRPTAEKVLEEAKKLFGWVIGEKGE